MKQRNDFVSNSSSSSFIVIADNFGEFKDLSSYQDDRKYIVPNYDGKTEFGWEDEITCDFFGKLNFCVMQCFYSKDFEKYFKMLHKVVLEYFKLDIEMIPLKHYTFDDGDEFDDLPSGMYIDHQSNASENRNMEMFESEDDLLKFLSNPNSAIHGGNDNS